MSKTVTLRLSEKTYERFRTLAERENRPLSNFIETAASRRRRIGERAPPARLAPTSSP